MKNLRTSALVAASAIALGLISIAPAFAADPIGTWLTGDKKGKVTFVSPLVVNAELAAADSFVAAWLPGGEGGGIADVLFRAADGRVHYDFRGRLPFPWPRAARPAAGAAPLFPLGFGLRYAARAQPAR